MFSRETSNIKYVLPSVTVVRPPFFNFLLLVARFLDVFPPNLSYSSRALEKLLAIIYYKQSKFSTEWSVREEDAYAENFSMDS